MSGGREERVTVVVPTRNSARTLRACLESVRRQAHPHVELIVVDNNSSDSTPCIAEELADVVERWGPERSAQRNRGATVATGNLLLFVDSDMVLEENVTAEVASRFALELDLGALTIPERAFGKGPWAPCRALEKDLYRGDPAVEAARAFRRTAFEEVGGYDETITGFEDWDLPDRVLAAGWRLDSIEAQVWHDEGHISLQRSFSKKRYYARGLAPYIAKPTRRRLRRRPRARALTASPVRGAGLVILKFVEAFGFVVGVAEAVGRRRS